MMDLGSAMGEGLQVIEGKSEEYKKLYGDLASKLVQFRCLECGTTWQRKGEDVLKDIEKTERLSYERLGSYASRFDMVNETICKICRKKGVVKERLEYFKSVSPPKYHDIELYANHQKLLEKHWNKNLFITGNVGTGKTVFALAVAKKRVLERNYRVSFESYPKLVLRLQSSFDKKGESAYRIAEEAAGFNGLLILDDLGAEKTSDYVRQITYFIINEREQYQREMLITSNLSIAEIRNQLDERLSSRIIGMCEVIELAKEDYRRVKA